MRLRFANDASPRFEPEPNCRRIFALALSNSVHSPKKS